MAGSEGGANNLVQDFEESFQVGDLSFLSTPGVGKPWSEAGANNLAQDYEESFQVGGRLICPPLELERSGARPGQTISSRILRNHST